MRRSVFVSTIHLLLLLHRTDIVRGLGNDGRAEDGGGEKNVLHLCSTDVRAAGSAGVP
jgi:hypothetical protein